MARKRRRRKPEKKKEREKQWRGVLDAELPPQLYFSFSHPRCRPGKIKIQRKKKKEEPLLATFHVS